MVINLPPTSTTNVVFGLRFSQSHLDLEGFLWALWFPPSSKTDSFRGTGPMLKAVSITEMVILYEYDSIIIIIILN